MHRFQFWFWNFLTRQIHWEDNTISTEVSKFDKHFERQQFKIRYKISRWFDQAQFYHVSIANSASIVKSISNLSYMNFLSTNRYDINEFSKHSNCLFHQSFVRWRRFDCKNNLNFLIDCAKLFSRSSWISVYARYEIW